VVTGMTMNFSFAIKGLYYALYFIRPYAAIQPLYYSNGKSIKVKMISSMILTFQQRLKSYTLLIVLPQMVLPFWTPE
jgi:hypothetical protein